MNLTTYPLIFTLGIIIGSFLNVCIYRIPDKTDIIKKRSHCLGCGNVLEWYELIPLFSFFWQGGRCRECKEKISWQYPLVELLNGLLYIIILSYHGLTVVTVLYCLCVSSLIVLSVIDWRTLEIPLGCNIIIGLSGIVRLFTDIESWYLYLLGFIVVSGLFVLIYLLTKGRGIGGGDIKLMAAAGLLLGWQNIILALVIGCVAGSMIHLLLMKFKGKERVLAFGPYLAFGILIAMLWGNEIMNWYLASWLL